MGVPTYYSRLLDNASLNMDSCKNIRLFISGSAPLTEKIQLQFLKRAGKKIIERYGMSEAGIITATPPWEQRLCRNSWYLPRKLSTQDC